QAARQQHAMINTPEARLANRERELVAIEQQRQEAFQRQQSEAFVAQHIAPRINGLATSLPQDDVTQSAFYGKVAALTAPYLVNGRVPPDRLPEVVRIIDTALTPWAESLVQSRAATETKEKQELRQQVTAAKVALALAKKTQQRALAPQGRAGALR